MNATARNNTIRMTQALVDHLRNHPDADVEDGLGALVLHAQGDKDQLDDGQLNLLLRLRLAAGLGPNA